VVGSFNGWDPETATPLAPAGGSLYAGIVVLNPGDVIAYKFMNGATFAGLETVPGECGVDDGFGNFNRTYTVTEESLVTLPVVCFGGCSSCVFEPVVSVTFQVDLGGLTPSPDGVHIAGTFNNFTANSTPMILVNNNVYSATVQMDPNQIIQYKFLNGNAWGEDELVPFECGVDNGFGGFNRSLNVGEVSITLPEVCFSSCQDCPANVFYMEENPFKIYPNPANDNVIFELGENSVSNIRIFDMQGRVVQTVPVFGRFKLVVDVTELANGLYSVVTDTGLSKGIFAVQR
jgi:hypothetical protein